MRYKKGLAALLAMTVFLTQPGISMVHADTATENTVAAYKNVIVKSENPELDIHGAMDKREIGTNTYLLSYENEEGAKNAYQSFINSSDVQYVDQDVKVTIQTKDTDDQEEKNPEEENIEEADQEEADQKNSDQEEDSIKEKKDEDTSKTDMEDEEPETDQTDLPNAEEETKQEALPGEPDTEIPKESVEDDIFRIALPDTGIDAGTASVTAYIEDTGVNLSGTGDAGSTMDDNGHGTAMAETIIAALEENGVNAEKVKILPIKALNSQGEGSISSIYQSIQSAIDQKADMIVLGVSSKTISPALDEIIKEAKERNIMTLCAAGNDSTDIREYAPANSEYVTVISSIKNKEEAAEYTNYGAVDFCSYGERDVLVSGKQMTVKGTSISCAYTAGVAASFGKGISIEERYQKLKEKAVSMPEASAEYFGNGRIGDAPDKVTEEEPEKEEVRSEETKEKDAEKQEKRENTLEETSIKKEKPEVEIQDVQPLGASDNTGRYYNPAEVYDNVSVPYHHIVFNLMCDSNANRTSTATSSVTPLYTRFYGSCNDGSVYEMIKAVYNNTRGSNTEALCFIDAAAHTYTIKDHIDSRTEFCTNPSESKWLTPSKRGYKDGKFMVANPVGASKPFRNVGDKKLKGWGIGSTSSSIYFRASYGYDIHYYKRNTSNSSDYQIQNVSDDLNGVDIISDPQKTGYLFQGWSLNQQATTPDKYNGNTIKHGTHIYSIRPSSANDTSTHRDLYAIWNPISYKIRYHRNGATSGTIHDTQAEYDKSVNLSNNAFVRTGYQFKGWSTSANGKVKYANQASVKNLADTNGAVVHLYAVWEPIKYQVKYHGNGATSGSMKNSIHTYDEWKPLDPNGYVRQFKVDFETGCTDVENPSKKNVPAAFNGWMKSSTGTKIDYEAKDSIRNLSSTQGAVVSLYANWTDGTVKLPKLKRYGYDHLGWSSNKNASGADKGYTPNAEVVVSSDKKLYAVWKEQTRDIIYNANDGTGTVQKEKKKYTQTYVIKQNSFIRLGYEFVGWDTRPDGKGDKTYDPGTSYTKHEDLTLYAIWKENFKVAYIGNEQTAGLDFIDEGADQLGHPESLEYTFDENLEEADNPKTEHFNKKEEVDAYVDAETGQTVRQTVRGTVVSWSMDKDMTPKKMKLGVDAYVLGAEIKGEKLVLLAKEKGGDAWTPNAPNNDYGKFPKDSLTELKENQSVYGAPLPVGVRTFYNGIPYINLYAVWDMGPVIEAYDRYYTLEEAQEGLITRDSLLDAAEAYDEELKSSGNKDGKLKKKNDEKNHTVFDLCDYQESDFTQLKDSADISVTYRAKDAAGNVTKKTVMVHIIDSRSVPKEPEEGKIRFISKKYLNTLSDNSIWKKNEDYKKVLEEAVSYKRENPKKTDPLPIFGEAYTKEIEGTGSWNKTPQQVWEFKRKDVVNVQSYIKENGISSCTTPEGYQSFLKKFADCKK